MPTVRMIGGVIAAVGVAIAATAVVFVAVGRDSACAAPVPSTGIRHIESAGVVNGFVNVSDDGRYVLLADGESGWDRVDTRTGVRERGDSGGWLTGTAPFADSVTGPAEFTRIEVATGRSESFSVPVDVLGSGFRLREVRAAAGGRTVLSIGQEGWNPTLYLYDDATQTLITDTPIGLGLEGAHTSFVSLTDDGSLLTTIERSVWVAQPSRWVRRDLERGTVTAVEMPTEHDAVLGPWFASPSMEWVWFRSAAGGIVDGIGAGSPQLYRRNAVSGETIAVPVDLDAVGSLLPDDFGGVAMLSPAIDRRPTRDAQLYHWNGGSQPSQLTVGFDGAAPDGPVGPGWVLGGDPLIQLSAGSVITFTSYATNLVAETLGAEPGARLFQIDLSATTSDSEPSTTATVPAGPIGTSPPATIETEAATTTSTSTTAAPPPTTSATSTVSTTTESTTTLVSDPPRTTGAPTTAPAPATSASTDDDCDPASSAARRGTSATRRSN